MGGQRFKHAYLKLGACSLFLASLLFGGVGARVDPVFHLLGTRSESASLFRLLAEAIQTLLEAAAVFGWSPFQKSCSGLHGKLRAIPSHTAIMCLEWGPNL